jgi:hypothetical protein
MPRALKLVGQRFGRLTVHAKAFSKFPGGIYWLCDCDCGNQIVATSGHLQNGTRSCGCGKRERLKALAPARLQANLRHGHASRKQASSIYRRWHEMIQRCNNPNHQSFKNYGGRGIKVCDRWLESFQIFVADMGEPPDGMTLDRINNDGNYEPDNCRWATRAVQNRNQRRNDKKFGALIG